MKQGTVLLLAIVVTLGGAAHAAPKPKSISGEVVFENDHKPDYMPSFRFVGEGQNGPYITNVFGAPGAEITVKNAKGEIVGVGTSNPDGTFKISVSPSNFYQLAVGYNGRSIEKTTSAIDASQTIRIDMGRFE